MFIRVFKYAYTQNKKRIFEKEKIEYTLRTVNSLLLKCKLKAKICLKILILKIIIDHNSNS